MLEYIVADALETVPGLEGKVFPLAAARDKRPPFAVFGKATESEMPALDGGTGLWVATLELHLIANDYNTLKAIEAGARKALTATANTEAHGVCVQDMTAATTDTEELLPNTEYDHTTLTISATWTGGKADG